jgi:hypothetical protein
MIKIHRILGICLGAFILMHLVNHLALFWGVEHHIAIQQNLRKVYRFPLIEPFLICGFAVQLFIGIRLLMKRGWPRRFWQKAQIVSGLLFAFFLCQHIGAALYTRWFWPTIDTNVYWAASVVSRAPFSLYFVPYYIAGLAAIFVHFSAFIAIKHRATSMAWAIATVGVALSIAIVMALSGTFYPINLPPPYEAYLTGMTF